MSGAGAPFRARAVLFDCDGVLADSEGLVNEVVSEDLTARGWPLSPEASRETFLGMAVPTMVPVIEARVGPLPRDWGHSLAERIIARYDRLGAVPGSVEVVRMLHAAGVPLACASNSGREELRGKLGRLGLAEVFAGRVFSFEDVARPKPYPDIYLAAAAACGVAPADCAVVEDSAAGARAGVAAGCRVLGFTRDTPALDLLAAGVAETFADFAALPRLLGLIPEGVP